MKNEKEIAFLNDLSNIMKKHNVVFDITAMVIGYGGAEASLCFDIENSSYSNEIIDRVGGSFDIDVEHIDKVISRLSI